MALQWGCFMKSFLIRYRLQNASPEAWHKDVAEFIAALDSDPALQGKISYRCMKIGNSADYMHIATAADDPAVKGAATKCIFLELRGKNQKSRGWRGGRCAARDRRRDQIKGLSRPPRSARKIDRFGQVVIFDRQ